MAGVTLGIDLGTTGVKVMALDVRTGRIVAESAREYRTLHPVPEAHEQEPREWWAETRTAIRTTMTALAGHTVVAVGLSGQMHSLLLVDAEGAPVGPAMTWADRRVGRDTARLAADPRFRERTGNAPVDAFTAPKLAWLSRTSPTTLGRASRLVLAKDYIRHQLTGTWATDTTDAIGTLLYDVHHRRWDGDLWEAVGATHHIAPPVLASDEVAGTVTAEAARATGLPEGIPVATGAGDVPAAVLGTGVIHRGQVSLNVGTAAQAMRLTSAPRPGPGYVFGAAYGEQPFLTMASLYAAGASLRWASRVLLGDDGDINAVAAGAPPGADGLTYLPFMFGATVPRKNDVAAAGFIGQRDTHDRAALARAVIEGVAYGCADAVRVLAEDGVDLEEVRIVGGVTRSPLWREAFASVVDSRVVRVSDGGSPRGAALLGLLALEPGTADITALTGETAPVAGASGAAYERYQDGYARYRSRAAAYLDAESADPATPVAWTVDA